MNGLAGIVGQDRAVAQLRRALGGARVHHAYLFEGPDGVGRRATARAFAQACNCLVKPGDGCGACDACRKIDEDLHPDVKWFAVFNEEGKEKGQAQRVRELIATLGFPPHEGRTRVIVIEPADALNETAANILLKTLEEPPARTQFVLVTDNAARLLVTVRSRCQRIAFAPLPDEVVARILVQMHNCAPEAAAEAAAQAQGSLARAVLLSSSDAFAKRRAAVARLVEASRRGPRAALEVAGELGADREEVAALLELAWVTYRDALLVAGGLDAGVPEGARRDDARAAAAGSGTAALLASLRRIAEAREALDGNVGGTLTLEALVLALGRAQGGASR